MSCLVFEMVLTQDATGGEAPADPVEPVPEPENPTETDAGGTNVEPPKSDAGETEIIPGDTGTATNGEAPTGTNSNAENSGTGETTGTGGGTTGTADTGAVGSTTNTGTSGGATGTGGTTTNTETAGTAGTNTGSTSNNNGGTAGTGTNTNGGTSGTTGNTNGGTTGTTGTGTAGTGSINLPPTGTTGTNGNTGNPTTGGTTGTTGSTGSTGTAQQPANPWQYPQYAPGYPWGYPPYWGPPPTDPNQPPATYPAGTYPPVAYPWGNYPGMWVPPGAAPTPTNGVASAPTTLVDCGLNRTLSNYGLDCVTCQNLSAMCAMKKERKCYCNTGYVALGEKCVLPEDCNAAMAGQCSKNETYSKRGYDCNTCDNFNSGNACSWIEKPKCYCKMGYVRNSEGACINIDDCPMNTGCPINQTKSNVGYDCLTCQNLDAPCSLMRKDMCYCDQGFVRDQDTGMCILEQDCPILAPSTPPLRPPLPPSTSITRCKVNETYNRSGSDCFCNNRPCVELTAIKCYCNDGYVKDRFNRCVLLADCPAPTADECKSMKNEVCFRCIKTCRNPDTSLQCPDICRKCDCPAGQLRNDLFVCVGQRRCPTESYNFPFYNRRGDYF